ncbi:MAG: histidine-type phosphatase [Selenomonadaceae bacterium]|nr:histidine-type phosphatase [Selenomonadaceae bacterium]
MLKKFFAIVAIILVANVVPVQAARSADFHDKYNLTGMVVLSRHNIRAPLVDKNSAISKVTPHKWIKWTSAPSELSMRGGEEETIMGQYFRKWLVSENLITENYLPAEGEVRFYANSRQRTVATAQFFSSGMLPVANVRIERKYPTLDTRDPVFKPKLTFVNDKFVTLANAQIKALYGDKTPKDSYRLLEKVLDFKDSEIAKSEGLKHFRDEDFEVIFKLGDEPVTTGTLKLANQAADALSLQYYEEDDPVKATFGHKLSAGDWQKISAIKDFYNDVLFTAPMVAVNIAHPLLQVMNDELSLDRKFTFLCGHDSNIASILAALEVEDYLLPQTIERKTPIGVKFVIEKWRGNDGVDYAATSLVYASTEQLRNKTTLTLENPPMIYPIRFKGLTQNADGLYRLEDLQQRFQQAINVYDNLPTSEAA